jgi:4-hydroxy-tetrahydrodipicolinate reductase
MRLSFRYVVIVRTTQPESCGYHSSQLVTIHSVKIALLGYGKMGHEIEAVALAVGHDVVAKFDVDNPVTDESLRSSKADVAIDFSQPDAVEKNVKLVLGARLPLVIGTTGWEKSRESIRSEVERSGTGCIFASNFSIGVNLFLQVARYAAELYDRAGYDAFITEAHHRAKKDFPSGTALRLAEEVLAAMKSKSKIISELEQGNAIASDALHVSSIRSGAIPGTHTLSFESAEDSIEITHRARSRRGFAVGAVKAAEWIASKKGFYRFEEHVSEILERS